MVNKNLIIKETTQQRNKEDKAAQKISNVGF